MMGIAEGLICLEMRDINGKVVGSHLFWEFKYQIGSIGHWEPEAVVDKRSTTTRAQTHSSDIRTSEPLLV